MIKLIVSTSLLSLLLTGCLEPKPVYLASGRSGALSSGDSISEDEDGDEGNAGGVQTPGEEEGPLPSSGDVKPMPDDTMGGGGKTPVPVVTDPMKDPVVVPPPVVISSDGDGLFEGPWKVVERYADRNPAMVSFSLNASASKIFPKGNGQSPNQNQKNSRRVQVYIPPNIDKSKEYPFMIGMDADWWTNPLLSSMDRLISEKKIPVMIGIFVDNGGGDSRGNQRGFEYDKVHDLNARYMAEEVLPEVERRYGIKLTKNGEGGGLFGGSSSGAAAFTACWFMPDRFRKVLGYSSTFTTQGGDDRGDEGA